jgi:hypothetical protein
MRYSNRRDKNLIIHKNFLLFLIDEVFKLKVNNCGHVFTRDLANFKTTQKSIICKICKTI